TPATYTLSLHDALPIFHQSLRKNGINAFVSDKEDLSEVGKAYLAGLLAHARASSALSTPTINGYKRYRPYSLAPDRVVWGKENRSEEHTSELQSRSDLV